MRHPGSFPSPARATPRRSNAASRRVFAERAPCRHPRRGGDGATGWWEATWGPSLPGAAAGRAGPRTSPPGPFATGLDATVRTRPPLSPSGSGRLGAGAAPQRPRRMSEKPGACTPAGSGPPSRHGPPRRDIALAVRKAVPYPARMGPRAERTQRRRSRSAPRRRCAATRYPATRGSARADLVRQESQDLPTPSEAVRC